jgi:predicted dehydrogenase
MAATPPTNDDDGHRRAGVREQHPAAAEPGDDGEERRSMSMPNENSAQLAFRNGYRAGWELFLKHVAEDAPFPSPLLEGAKSVQLAEACYQSHRERRWVDLPELKL